VHGRTIRRERGCGRRFEKLTSLWKVKIQSYRVLLGCGTRDIEVHGVPIGILKDCRSVLLLSLVAVDHWEDVLDRCGFAREEILSLSLLPTRVNKWCEPIFS